jgi:hypothetical protein
MMMMMMIFDYFSKNSRKFKFPENLATITDTLNEDQYTFMIISHLSLLRIRNV